MVTGANGRRQPRRIDHLIERLWRVHAEHRADLLEVAENRILADVLGSRRDGSPVRPEFVLRRLGQLAKLVARALQVLAKALNRVQAENFDQGFPLLRLGLVDEVGERASTKQERFTADDVECLGVPLVRDGHFPAKRAVRENLDRRDVVALAADVGDGVLAAFMRQQLDPAGEVPLQCVGDGALPVPLSP